MGCTDRIERIKAALRLANRAGLTGRETTVLAELATHDFNPEHPGVVYPSLSTLAETVEIDRKHLPALLQSITAKGCVSCVHRGGGRGNPSRYRIHYDAQPDRTTRSMPRGADGRFASTAGNVPYPRDRTSRELVDIRIGRMVELSYPPAPPVPEIAAVTLAQPVEPAPDAGLIGPDGTATLAAFMEPGGPPHPVLLAVTPTDEPSYPPAPTLREDCGRGATWRDRPCPVPLEPAIPTR